MGPGVALALRDASGSGGVVVGGVAGSCELGWVGRESEVVEDVADEVRIADVREDGAGSSAGALAIDAKNNLVRALGKGKKVIALVGVNDLVVVETNDAILVIPRDRAQDVRLVVEALKASGRTDLL